MKCIHFITFTIIYLICLKIMKKVESSVYINKFYKWYATTIWMLYSIYVFLS